MKLKTEENGTKTATLEVELHFPESIKTTRHSINNRAVGILYDAGTGLDTLKEVIFRRMFANYLERHNKQAHTLFKQAFELEWKMAVDGLPKPKGETKPEPKEPRTKAVRCARQLPPEELEHLRQMLLADIEFMQNGDA